MNFNIMLLAIPVFFTLIIVEYFVAKHQQKEVYRLNDTISNLNIGVGSQIFSVLTKGLIYAVIFFVYKHFAIFQFESNWLSFLILFVSFDFVYYWAHRWGHKVNFFWGAHVVHHQSEEYNLSVALRQPWIHHLIAFPIFLIFPILGFDPVMIGIVSIIATLYQFWIHTRTIDKLPRIIEFLFNTPSHHRVHHAVNPKYIDKNHGAIFIIWDRIFGTFQLEEKEAVYGVTNNFNSFNPAKANYDYYIHLFKEMKQFSFLEKVKMLFAAPGWTPKNLHPEEQLKNTDLNRDKFNPKIPLGFSLYAFLQFIFIIWGTIAFMGNYESLKWTHQIYFAALIIFSLVICSGILELKKWVFFAEYSRLILVALSINLLYYFKYMNWFLVVFVLSLVGITLCLTWFSISLGKNFKQIVTA